MMWIQELSVNDLMMIGTTEFIEKRLTTKVHDS